MKRRFALSFVVVAILLAGSGKAEEPRGEHELVPKGLKDWSVEYYARCREGDTKITINSTGAVRVQHFRVGKRSELTLPASDVAAILATSRDFFNHYRVRDGGFSTDSDVIYYFTFKSKSLPLIQIVTPPSRVGPLGLNPFLARIDAVLRRNGIKDLDTFQDRHLDRPDMRPQRELIPTRVAKPWNLSIHQGSERKSDYLTFGATIASLAINSIDTKFEYPAEYSEKSYALARRFFNEYTLPIETTDAAGVEEKYFSLSFTCHTSLTVSCSRQMLIKMGLLDEFDALVADANRRLAEKDEKARFQAPWEE